MSVSDCESFSALVKPSPRGFARTLLLGGMFVAAAMTAQNFKSSPHQGAGQRRPALLSFIDARPLAPSVYDEEHRMSSAQLLNRWDAFVTEASQRFHVPRPGYAP